MFFLVPQLGARVDKFPVELEGFDIWCVSTSHFLNERKQTIDLIQNGFSAIYLDEVRPAIKIYEWFVYCLYALPSVSCLCQTGQRILYQDNPFCSQIVFVLCLMMTTTRNCSLVFCIVLQKDWL